jgi:Icc-related predicted phosphoesterase
MSSVRLLLFSDLHRNTDRARELMRRAAGFDAVVGAGDFATAREGLREIIDILASIEVPAVLVPGNSESFDELREACEEWPSAIVLHGTGATVAGVEFFGIGGAVPVTPFGSWSYDFTEEQAATLLADCPTGGVLVSHSPPRGAVDSSGTGQHLGSAAVRDVIERRAPRLVVCGHIHASAGRHETLGESVVVNAGPAGMEWTLDTTREPIPTDRGRA